MSRDHHRDGYPSPSLRRGWHPSSAVFEASAGTPASHCQLFLIAARSATGITRLRRERDTLERLAGLAVVPGRRDWLTVGEHRFLVQGFIEGTPLHLLIVQRYPLLGRQIDERDATGYASWAVDVYGRVESAADALHGRCRWRRRSAAGEVGGRRAGGAPGRDDRCARRIRRTGYRRANAGGVLPGDALGAAGLGGR